MFELELLGGFAAALLAASKVPGCWASKFCKTSFMSLITWEQVAVSGAQSAGLVGDKDVAELGVAGFVFGPPSGQPWAPPSGVAGFVLGPPSDQ